MVRIQVFNIMHVGSLQVNYDVLKSSSSTKVDSSVNYDSLQTEHYCKLNALELCPLQKSDA